MAILKQKMHHSYFYFPEALFDKLKHVTITIISLKEAIWFLFEAIRYYHYKVVVINFVLGAKFFKFTCLWGKN